MERCERTKNQPMTDRPEGTDGATMTQADRYLGLSAQYQGDFLQSHKSPSLPNHADVAPSRTQGFCNRWGFACDHPVHCQPLLLPRPE